MKLSNFRRFAFATLLLFVSACSTTDDVTDVSTLSPQFGTSDIDIGVDVAPATDGGTYVVSDRRGDDEENYEDYTRVYLRRYSSGGTLRWETLVAEARISSGAGEPYRVSARTLEPGPQGKTYALTTLRTSAQDSITVFSHTVYVTNPNGGRVGPAAGFRLGTTGRNFGDPDPDNESENAVAIAVDTGGNFYAALERLDLDELYDSGQEIYTNLVSKYAPDGTLLWQRTLAVGTPYAAANAPSGVYVAGTGGLARYGSSGSLIWVKTGAPYTVGSYAKAVASGSGLVVRDLDTLRKFDATGKLLWTRVQGGLKSLVIQDVTVGATDDVYLSGKYAAVTGNWNAFVRKLNSSGTVLWTKTYGTAAFDDARGVTTSSGSIYLTGETQASLGPANQGQSDAYLRRLNSNGTVVWTR